MPSIPFCCAKGMRIRCSHGELLPVHLEVHSGFESGGIAFKQMIQYFLTPPSSVRVDKVFYVSSTYVFG